MKKIHFVLCTITIAFSAFFGADRSTAGDLLGPFDPDKVKPTSEEIKLHRLINEYRAGRGLALVPLSRSLTYVAQMHARDLQDNHPAKGACNMHSWSDKGKWTQCCYTSDHRAAACMWNKPRELTVYKGKGYEISHGTWGASPTAESALKSWQGSSGHNAVIISSGIWKSHPWKAVGAGIYGGYAVVWFGEEADPAGNLP